MTEYTALMLLDHTAAVAAVCTQPLRMDFADGTSHFPDGLVVYANGRQELFDVRPAHLVDHDAVEQFAKTAQMCEQIGWTHRLIVDIPLVHGSTLRPSPQPGIPAPPNRRPRRRPSRNR